MGLLSARCSFVERARVSLGAGAGNKMQPHD